MYDPVKVSPFTTDLVVVKARESIVPAEAALNTPTSSTVTEPEAVQVVVTLKVSFVTAVVTRETVPPTRASPSVVISATRVVLPTAGAVDDVLLLGM